MERTFNEMMTELLRSSEDETVDYDHIIQQLETVQYVLGHS
jgi:hypothetical protein